MTSSPDRLPPALPSMWRVLKLGYRHERRALHQRILRLKADTAA